MLPLPGLSGLELVPRLHAIWPDVGIIILTLHDEDAYRQAALAAGADNFVPKRTLTTDLLPAIRRCARRGDKLIDRREQANGRGDRLSQRNEAAMNPFDRLFVFTLDEQRYALHLSAVHRVVRAAEVTSLPKAPAIVLGVVNVQGQIIPVVNLRRRFRLPERDIGLSDQLIIARTSRRAVALVADAVTGVIDVPGEKVTAGGEVVPGLEYVEGVARLEDGLILIHDLAAFLSLDEEQALDEALRD